MIDLKALREKPEIYKAGAAQKQMDVDIDRVLALDSRHRELLNEQETLRAEQKKLAKETGPKIGQLSGKLKSASGDEKAAIEAEIAELKNLPAKLKADIHALDEQIAEIHPELDALLLEIPTASRPRRAQGHLVRRQRRDLAVVALVVGSIQDHSRRTKALPPKRTSSSCTI